MPTNILMPALSPTMEKGNLSRWLKKEGDKVKSGDVLAEIETDKATMEYEAVDEGTLAKIVVPEGTQDVAVNSVIAVLAGEGEDVKTAASAAGSVPPKAAEKKTEPVSASPQPSPQRGADAGSAAPRAPNPSPGSVESKSPPKPSVKEHLRQVQIAFSRRHSRVVSQRKQELNSTACKAQDRMAA